MFMRKIPYGHSASIPARLFKTLLAPCHSGRRSRNDVMNEDSLRDWYLALRDSDKLVFLALVSGELTIHGRGIGFYESGEQLIRGFKGLNELQHQISGHIVGIALGHDRYPDDVLWKILDEKASAHGLSSHLKHSLEAARSRDLWNQLT